LNNIGCSLFELDELQVAKVAFQEALDIQRSLLRKDHREDGTPISQQTMLSIASTQSNIASIKLYSGQYEEACVDLEEALLIQQCVLGDDHPLAQRTQDSLLWMEQSRQNGANLSLDILTRLAASMTVRDTDNKRDKADGMFNTLYSGIDAACQGWNRGSLLIARLRKLDFPVKRHKQRSTGRYREVFRVIRFP
jgi:tetratricopeptide (TPR) repeat protein